MPTEAQKQARCNEAYGLVRSAMVLLLKVHKDDIFFYEHKPSIEKAISELLIAKHFLAHEAGFTKD